MQHRRQLGGHSPQGGLFLDADRSALLEQQHQHADARGTQGDGQGQPQPPGPGWRAPDGPLLESLEGQGGAARFRLRATGGDRAQNRPLGPGSAR
jgi:hypothetical protein